MWLSVKSVMVFMLYPPQIILVPASYTYIMLMWVVMHPAYGMRVVKFGADQRLRVS